MGAHFCISQVRKDRLGKSSIESYCHDLIRQCEYDYGHSGYTGSFAEADGIEVTGKTFNDYDAAEEWLDQNARKWGSILVVTVRNVHGFDYWVFGALCSA